MTQRHRLLAGGRIDRARPVRFVFDGQAYDGCAGDTLASALLANGVHLVARSFKYHRPRGILAAGSEEPNALVTVTRGRRTTPNVRATEVEIFDGLVAESQNRWPSLAFDAGAVNGLVAPLFPAGFYYKTFMGPRFLGSNRAWTRIYEPLIRRAAGLGRAPTIADADHYAQRYAHADVLVIGAGPAGLAAALAAARSGARVVLCDEQAELGGSLLSAGSDVAVDAVPARQWIERALGELAANPRVRLLPRTTAFGYFLQNLVGLAERVTDHLARPDPELPRERLWQVRATEVVLATGAIERPLVFAGNDRPGIMLAGAAQTYVNRYGVAPGRRAVLLTACDTGYRAAMDLDAAGIVVEMIADLRPTPDPDLIAMAERAAIPVETAATIIATRGRKRVSGVTIGHVDAAGYVTKSEDLACDLVLMSGGWTPSVHLFSQSRGKLAYDEALMAYVPGQAAERQRSAGACRGILVLADAAVDGSEAGAAAAARALGRPAPPSGKPVKRRSPGAWVGACPGVEAAGRVKAFVDFQNDVLAADIALAVQEGFRSIEHVKRYTTTGMATDQGKTSNLNALSIAAEALARPMPAVGLTTFRQPVTPVTFGTLAGVARGELFDPVRRTPIDPWAREQGAVFEDVGAWKRARYFPVGREDMDAAVRRECTAVRARAGLFDASTLGKIEVVGPDAAEFLERMYVNAFKGLAAGRCRYGLLLSEAGFVIDDGVIGRLGPDRFHVTTTTGGAARVLQMMEDYLQTEWPDLDVWLTSTTEQWAVIAVQGPRARDIVAPLVSGLDVSAARFPHMAVAEGRVAGLPARIFRVSFTGELGFEINVPADCGRGIWEALWREGRRHDAVAYGTEAMHVLRAEKGFVIVGQETDGTVTPADLGLDRMIGRKKRDFVGKRSLVRPDMLRDDRPELVGLLTRDARTILEEGAQITDTANPAVGTPALGHVTSSYWSPALGRPIALALVAGGRARIGQQLWASGDGGDPAVEVVQPLFYDPEGAKLHG